MPALHSCGLNSWTHNHLVELVYLWQLWLVLYYSGRYPPFSVYPEGYAFPAPACAIVMSVSPDHGVSDKLSMITDLCFSKNGQGYYIYYSFTATLSQRFWEVLTWELRGGWPHTSLWEARLCVHQPAGCPSAWRAHKHVPRLAYVLNLLV